MQASWFCKLEVRRAKLGKPVDTLGWQLLGFEECVKWRKIYWNSTLLSFDVWHKYSPFGEVEPFLVLPGYGKAFDVRSVATLWYKPESVFATTYDVFIIGLSLAPDDFFIRSFFLSNLPYVASRSDDNGRRIYIVNPDPATEKNYEFVLSQGHAEWLKEPFSNSHVSLMKERLENA